MHFVLNVTIGCCTYQPRNQAEISLGRGTYLSLESTTTTTSRASSNVFKENVSECGTEMDGVKNNLLRNFINPVYLILYQDSL